MGRQRGLHLDPARADVFYEAVRSYWPALPDHALAPGYTGIRPKISGPREPAADFDRRPRRPRRARPGQSVRHRIPGLTSSLALADETLARLAAA